MWFSRCDFSSVVLRSITCPISSHCYCRHSQTVATRKQRHCNVPTSSNMSCQIDPQSIAVSHCISLYQSPRGYIKGLQHSLRIHTGVRCCGEVLSIEKSTAVGSAEQESNPVGSAADLDPIGIHWTWPKYRYNRQEFSAVPLQHALVRVIDAVGGLRSHFIGRSKLDPMSRWEVFWNRSYGRLINGFF